MMNPMDWSLEVLAIFIGIVLAELALSWWEDRR